MGPTPHFFPSVMHNTGPTLNPGIGLCNSLRLSSSLPSGHPIRLNDLFLGHPDREELH